MLSTIESTKLLRTSLTLASYIIFPQSQLPGPRWYTNDLIVNAIFFFLLRIVVGLLYLYLYCVIILIFVHSGTFAAFWSRALRKLFADRRKVHRRNIATDSIILISKFRSPGGWGERTHKKSIFPYPRGFYSCVYAIYKIIIIIIKPNLY